jgi:hypothetical protein
MATGVNPHAAVHGPVYSIPASVGDGRMEMSLSATADHSLFVFHASSFDRPDGDLCRQAGQMVMAACAGSENGNVTQLTHLNDGVEPAWGKVRFVELEERQIQGAGLADAAQRTTIRRRSIR